MKFRAKIQVRQRREQMDPESETVRKSLMDLNFQVSQVKTAKIYEIVFDAESRKDAEASAKLMCTRLLVNPIKDDYKFEVEQVGGTPSQR